MNRMLGSGILLPAVPSQHTTQWGPKVHQILAVYKAEAEAEDFQQWDQTITASRCPTQDLKLPNVCTKNAAE